MTFLAFLTLQKKLLKADQRPAGENVFPEVSSTISNHKKKSTAIARFSPKTASGPQTITPCSEQQGNRLDIRKTGKNRPTTE